MNIISKFQLSTLALLRFGIYDVVDIWRKRHADSLNELITYRAVCRTAPATPGLLKISQSKTRLLEATVPSGMPKTEAQQGVQIMLSFAQIVMQTILVHNLINFFSCRYISF